MDIADLPTYAAPLLSAIIVGGLIGFEREWRGRSAGLRTHILVCLASALLMEASVMQGQWRFMPLPDANIVSDPARMAHGVLTGIGFLCAGVIFRSGFSIHGLTTAASLWITSAIGIAFGAGLYGLGLVAATLTLVVLVGLRLVSARLPQTSVVDAEVVWSRDHPDAEDRVIAALKAASPRPKAPHRELRDEGRTLKLGLRLPGMSAEDLAALASRLNAVDGVLSYDLNPRDD